MNKYTAQPENTAIFSSNRLLGRKYAILRDFTQDVDTQPFAQNRGAIRPPTACETAHLSMRLSPYQGVIWFISCLNNARFMGLKRLFRKAILHIPLCNEEKAELFFIPSYIKT